MKNDQTKHRYASVNALDLASLSWEKCESMPIAVEGPGIAAIENNLYAMGGHNGHDWSCQAIKLNTQTGKITKCNSMHKGVRVYSSIVAIHHHIFVLAKSLFAQYDIMKDQWTELQLPPTPSDNPAMVMKQDHLLLLGGHEKDYKNPNDVIQKYDLSSKKWSLEARKMPLPLSYHWAFVMNVPQLQ